jgi:hypothetical protein
MIMPLSPLRRKEVGRPFGRRQACTHCIIGDNFVGWGPKRPPTREALKIWRICDFTGPDGTNTNAIEGFFARVERAYIGVHHRFSTKYLEWYMAMIAWKEDTRYMGVAWQFCDILRTVTHHRVEEPQGLLAGSRRPHRRSGMGT